MLETLFAAVAEAVFNLLVTESGLTERVRAVLGVDPERRAFQLALARASEQFVKQHPDWAAALFDQYFLTRPEVVELLATLLSRRGQPDPARLAALWAAQLHRPNPPQEVEAVAAAFLRLLDGELAARPELRALHDSRDLAAIRADTDAMATELAALRSELATNLQHLQTTFQASLREALARLQHGSHRDTDLDLIRTALRGGQIAVVSGDRAVHLGGNANDAVIVTGNNNQIVVLKGDAAGIARQLTPSPVPPPSPVPQPLALGNPYPPNPFTPLSGRITDPSRVFGRKREVQQALALLKSGSSVAFIGESGVGKSSLLTLLSSCAVQELAREPVLLDMQLLHSEDDYYEALCEELGIALVRGRRLERTLRTRRVLLMLDEIEKMTWDGFSLNLRAELRGLAEGEDAPFKLVLVARSPLDRLFPDSDRLTSPLAGICEQITVSRWDETTARAFINQRLSSTPVRFSDDVLARLYQVSRGLPCALMQEAYNLYRSRTSGNV